MREKEYKGRMKWVTEGMHCSVMLLLARWSCSMLQQSLMLLRRRESPLSPMWLSLSDRLQTRISCSDAAATWISSSPMLLLITTDWRYLALSRISEWR